MENSLSNWYDKSYKILLVVPLIVMVLCLFYIGSFYSNNGDFINKDTSLSGGTTVTISDPISSDELKAELQKSLDEVNVREIRDVISNQRVALIVESSSEPEIVKESLEDILGYTLDDSNSSIEFTGPSLSSSFYKQLIIAIIISFVLMSLVIFLLFKTFIPSIAVIFAAFSNIVMTLAFVNYFGVELSSAGIAAFLMLVGYSVDTDILLTTRVLRNREGSVNERIYGAFKTGSFMTITALIAIIPAFIIVTGLPDSFRQIFLILGVGLFADLINTWLTNASIIKWYATAKKI